MADDVLSPFTQRLQTIGSMGDSANNYASQLAAKRQASEEAARQAALQKKLQDAQAAQAKLQQQQMLAQQKQQVQQTPVAGLTGGGAAYNKNAKGNTFDAFLNAIVGQESGGNYSALGQPVGNDRAYGKYQIMGNNIPSWTRIATGRSYTPQQFLASPALQDAVAKHFLSGYYNKYGPAGAAVAWYAGEGTAKNYVKRTGSAAFNSPQYASGSSFPSINAYALSILKKMGLR